MALGQGCLCAKKVKNRQNSFSNNPVVVTMPNIHLEQQANVGYRDNVPNSSLLPTAGCGIDPGCCWHPNSLWEGVWSHGRGAMSSPALTPLLSLPTAVLSDYESAEDSEVRVTPDSHGISAQTHFVSLDPFPLSPEELTSPTPSPWHWDQCH